MKLLRNVLCGLFLLPFLITACSSVSSDSASTLTARAASEAAPTVTAAPTPTQTCEAAGQIAQYKIDSAALGEKLTFTVYLPPCYDALRPGGYPVLYLFHGQNMDDTFWPSIGITSAADDAFRVGHQPFIMVFPYEVHNWDLPAESHFGEAIMQDLFPWVEAQYNVCTRRACQAIGGLSRGGGWAMHIALTNFDTFGSVGLHSFGYFSGDLYRVQNLLQTYTPGDFPRIYIDRGDQDYLHEDIDLYEQNLTATGVVHEYVINPGVHEKAYWQSQVQNYLTWYMQGFDTAVK